MKDNEINYKALFEETISKLKIAKKNVGCYTFSSVIDKVIPEVAESEDERVKNEIVDYLKGFIPHHDDELVAKSKVWIAWLEKQREQKPTDTPTYKIGDFVHCTTVHGFGYTYIYEKNHGEVIHAFAKYSHETSGVLSIDDTLFEPSISTKRKATHEEMCTLLQSITKHGYEWDAEKKELRKQKPSWSEEDEKMFIRSRCYLTEYGNWLSGKNEEKSLSVYKACDWLKTLKDRMA